MRVSVTDAVCSGRAILAAIEAAGSTVAEVARDAGLHRPRLSEALHGRRKLPAEWLDKLPPAVLAPIVARLAERCGLGLCALPTPEDVTSDVRTLASVVRECGDVATAYADALSDGYLSAGEAAEIERECDEAIGVLLGVRNRARVAKRERVVGVAV